MSGAEAPAAGPTVSPTPATGRGFSLWLMPEGEIYRRFSALIGRLSARHQTPGFEPHVTLLSGLEAPREELLSRCGRLAHLIRPFVVRLTKPGHTDEYFRCLFMEAEDSEALLEAHALTCDVFARAEERPYAPHLSLLYGRLDAGQREKLMVELGRDLAVAFEVRSLHLFSTSGDPAAWHSAGRFALG